MVTGKGNEGRARQAVGGETAFGRALDELKTSGSGFLVTGAVPTAVHAASCRHFLGGDSEEPRGQVVLSGSGDQLHEDGVGIADRRRVVELATDYRSTETVAGTGQSAGTVPGPADESIAGGVRNATDLRELGLQTMDAIDAIEPLGGFDPGELRLCFDAFDAAAERLGEDALFEFLHLLLGRVRGLDGLAHAHFRGDRDAAPCEVFEPLFDGVVELRATEGGAEQRWHLLDAEVSSEWLALRV
ncbi:MAG: hypothetical protein ABEJ42_09230 [Halobacteriaceae archaeon]